MASLIVYGTLTGNTELVSHHLYEALSNERPDLGFELKSVNDMSAAELDNYTTIIFGISTYGEGEINPAAIDFFEELKQLDIDFSSKKIAVFGLGESTYEKYCTAADEVAEIAKSKGAQISGEIFKIDGYPSDDIIADVITWAKNLI